MKFNDKVILITGASRGIGRAISKEFAKLGGNIIINYNSSKEEALTLKEELENNYNVKAICIKANVSSNDEVKAMVDESIKVFGKIDILVNNAGIAIDSVFEDKNIDTFRKTLDINLIGTFLVSKYTSKHMLENKYGKIINIGSTNGIDDYYPFSMEYDASKAGIISLTNNLATQFAPYINVNCVAPGWVETEMNKDLSFEFKNNCLNKILKERFAKPEEIAKTVIFLASDDADFINSTIVRVDGGMKR